MGDNPGQYTLTFIFRGATLASDVVGAVADP
jgi:hypothetical protein